MNPNAHIVSSIPEDWFYLADFTSYKTFVYDVYETKGGARISGGDGRTDGSGFAWINSEGWDLEPGSYLVVSDGNTSKDLEVEGFTFNIFDTSNGVLLGTVPGQEGRLVWVGIGFEDDGWSMEVLTDVNGNWVADFGASVPDFQWVAAQIFDDDGDASELRPASFATLTIVANQSDWVDSGIALSAGQSYSVQAFGLMNPCSDTYPNGPEICIFYPPSGGDWVVPYDNIYGVFPGEGLPFMVLLGKVGDGQPFEIGEGGTFTAGQAGTLWLTPNDNFRTDNQGAYYVRVWLEP